MRNLISLARKPMIGGLAAVTVIASLAATAAPASAAPRGGHVAGRHVGGVGHVRNFGRFQHHGRFHHRGYHGGGRWIGPAVVGGLALGAFGASQYYGERCWLEPRRVVNRFGHVALRQAEVCG